MNIFFTNWNDNLSTFQENNFLWGCKLIEIHGYTTALANKKFMELLYLIIVLEHSKSKNNGFC